MNMKKILILIVFLYVGNIFGQTHVRKTRSDKGGKHKHSLNYEIKKAEKNSTSSHSSKTKSSYTTKRRKK
jgi:uncharacterized protein YxeA